VQQHVHAADAEHGAVEVVAVKGAGVEFAAAGFGLVDRVTVMVTEVFRRGDQKAPGPAGRVADHVLRRRRGHVHHQLDDVPRRAELAVLPGAGDLAEHVLVQVALGIGVRHVDAVELVHHVRQHARCGHHEDRVLHVVGVRRVALLLRPAVAPERLDERKDFVPHRGEHLLRRGLLEPRPAQVVFVEIEDRILDRHAHTRRLVLAQRLQLVQPLDEQQVSQLLDDRQRIRDAARPHRVPDAVDLGFEFTGDHESLFLFLLALPGRMDCTSIANVKLRGAPF
jgi:hypothetical protein